MSDQVKNTKCELENLIFQYKLKSLQSFRNDTYILEVNNQAVCLNSKNEMVLSNAPFPKEFRRHEIEVAKSKIHGSTPTVKTAREWYTSKLQKVKQLFNVQSIIGGQ